MKHITVLFQGLKRRIAKEKQDDGDGKIETGKIPMPFALYRRVSEYMIKDDNLEAIFDHAF